MLNSLIQRWLRIGLGRPRLLAARQELRPRSHFAPRLETLEDRTVLSHYLWVGVPGAFWSNPAAWVEVNGGVAGAPQNGDTAEFAVRAAQGQVGTATSSVMNIPGLRLGTLIVDATYNDKTITLNNDLVVTQQLSYTPTKGTFVGAGGQRTLRVDPFANAATVTWAGETTLTGVNLELTPGVSTTISGNQDKTFGGELKNAGTLT